MTSGWAGGFLPRRGFEVGFELGVKVGSKVAAPFTNTGGPFSACSSPERGYNSGQDYSHPFYTVTSVDNRECQHRGIGIGAGSGRSGVEKGPDEPAGPGHAERHKPRFFHPEKFAAGTAKAVHLSAISSLPYTPNRARPDGCLGLKCGNLPPSVSEQEIVMFFEDHGTVTSVLWLNDTETGAFTRAGWVTFSSTAEVDEAIMKGGELLNGYPIHIDFAEQACPQ